MSKGFGPPPPALFTRMVEAAEGLDRRGDDGREILLLRHVAGEADGPAAGLP